MRSRFVTIDLETRSACDLRQHGGHLYADHPTTRLLTVAWHADDEYHVWLPGVDRVPQALLDLHLSGYTVHLGPDFPPIPVDRPWVGHNSFGFDEVVWRRLAPDVLQPPKWIDSMCLALAAGLPAGLQHIGQRLWGEGKYKEGSNELKKASRAKGVSDCDAENVPVGSTVLVARYNVQDVKLTVDLMDELAASLIVPDSELEVLAAHREINNRGVKIDARLVSALYRLSNEAVEDCVTRIAELTDGFFPDADSLRKRTRVLEWVKSMGVDFGESLRREVVNQFVEEAGRELEARDELSADDDDGGDPIGNAANLALVVEVLQLRQSAMRITGAKLEAAGNRVDHAGIARALFAYWAAHTGRWAGRGIQVQNLPRAKDGVPVWPLVREYLRRGDLPIDVVRAYLTADQRRKRLKRPVTPDDAASALIRSLFVPHDGDECLLTADLAAIEARVLNWLAGSQWMVDIFAAGGDPYIEFCRKVTGETIKKKDPRRQVWKVILLGAGYQLGEDKLAVYAAAQGVDLTVAGLTPRTAIDAYRDAHPEIAGTVQGVFDGGRKWRKGGLWNDYNSAAITAVQTGTPVEAGRCLFFAKAGHLYVRLPSGRHLCYRNARLKPVVKWGKERLQVVYASPRWRDTALYGGKLCWSGDTLVLTDRGPVPIRSVTNRDRVWDGEDWVRCDGVAFNGLKETGRWLDQSVTGDHLIHDGNSWRPVTDLDVVSSVRSLRSAAGSLPSEWSHLAAGRGPRPGACATAATTPSSKRDGSCEGRSTSALSVGGGPRARNGESTPTCSRLSPSPRRGSTGIPEWCPDAPTQGTSRTATTAGAASECIPTGCETRAPSTSTPSRCPTGTSPDSTWIESGMTATTNPETYVWSRDESTVPTAVYDLVNCGPRHRYTVVTPHGCVLAHNCENITQAVASDFIRHALVKMRRAGLWVVLHVHDEIVASGFRDQLPLFMSIITEVPEWAPGFPLEAEGGWVTRYAKSPPKGLRWKEQVWRNGKRVK